MHQNLNQNSGHNQNQNLNQNPNSNQNQNSSLNPNSTPNIRLTESAVLHIKSLLQDAGEYPGIRIGVKASGCSGLSYVLDFIRDNRENDISFNAAGINMVLDPESLQYLEGMEIDCVQEGLNKHLKFNNPNVKGECGCGESFTVLETRD